MSYIVYKFNEKNCIKYKGYYYQKSNDKYLIFDKRGYNVGMRFTVKDCKESINELINK